MFFFLFSSECKCPCEACPIAKFKTNIRFNCRYTNSSFSNLASSKAQQNTEIVQKEITSVAVLEDLTTTNITSLEGVKVTKEIAELAEEIE